MTKEGDAKSGSEVRKNSMLKRDKSVKAPDNGIVGLIIKDQLENGENGHIKKASEEIPLLSGYALEDVRKQINDSSEKYKELHNTKTKKEIEGIQARLKNQDNFEGKFKFTPIFHNKHWCCGVITHDKVYVFDPTLQTQKYKSRKEGILKIGDTECEVTYLNHKKQIQDNRGRICGPCVVEFGKKIAELDSIGEIIKGCESGDIFKKVAQGVYNEFMRNLQGKSLQDEVWDDFFDEKTTYEKLIMDQFTTKYYNMINRTIVPQQEQREKEPQQQGQQEETSQSQSGENKQNSETGNGLYCISKSQNEDGVLSEGKNLLFKSLSQITLIKDANKTKTPEIETVEGIGIPIRRSHSVPTKTSKSKGELLL